MANLNRVLQNSTLYLIGNVASRAVGFLAIPFYSRFLSPTEFGIVELIELSTEIIAIALGLQAIGVALTRVFHDQKTLSDQRDVVSTGLFATAGFSALIAGVAILASGPLSVAVFHSADRTWLLRAAFVAMFFANMVEVVLVYERIQERAKFFLGYSLVTLAFNLVLNVYFIGFAHAGVWGFLLSKLIITSLGSLYLLTRVFREVGVHWRRKLIPELVRFGAPLAFSSLCFFLIHFSDRFFLTSAVTLADLGRYALAYRFAFLLSILVGDSFAKSWNVTFYRYAGAEGWQQQFGHVAHFLIFVLCTSALAISLFAPELLHFMVPPDFYPPALMLPLLVFGYVFRECGDFFRSLMLINRRSGRVGKIAGIGAGLNIAFNFALIPSFGTYGAAVATLLTWLIYMIVCWVVAGREHRVPVRPSSFLAIIAMVMAVYALAASARVSIYPAQVALDLIWVLLFVSLCLVFYFKPIELGLLRDGAADLVSRLLMRGAPRRDPGPIAAGEAKPSVLLLSHAFPPDDQEAAVRAGRFSAALERAGLDVSVIAANPRREAARGALSMPNVTRVPAAAGTERRLVKRTFLIRHAGRFLLPQQDCLPWMPHAVAAGARRLERAAPRVVISTHPPVAAHVAGLLLKRQYGLPWIADFRDPLSDDPARTGRRALLLDPMVERIVFANADAVIAGTDALAEEWRRRYPAASDKVVLIWDGIDANELAPAESRGGSAGRRSLVHVGLQGAVRWPAPAIRCFSRLVAAGTLDPASVQLRFVGPIEVNPGDPPLDSEGIELEPRTMPREAALAALRAADLLLLLDTSEGDRTSRRQNLGVPAELFTYIASRRPIVAFTPPGSVSARLLAQSGAPHVCIDPQGMPDAQDRLLSVFLGEARDAPAQASPAFLSEYNADAQLQTLARLVRRLSAKPAPGPGETELLGAAHAPAG